MMSFMKGYLFAIICACSLLFSTYQVNGQIADDLISSDAALASKGEEIFEGNCAQCHAVHEQVVGPALKEVWKRWPDLATLRTFIKYPERTIKGGNAYAASLYTKYKQMMPNHDFLSDEDIDNVLAYVKTAPVPVVVATGVPGEESDPKGIDSGLLSAIITGLTVVLVAVLGVMAILITVLVRNLKERDDLDEDQKDTVNKGGFSLRKFMTHPAFVGIAAFVFISIAGQKTLDGMFTVGVQQGYAPEQPIPFSHKLHAGYYEIDCKYCHTGVEKSKNANIPSANICMNCHNSIRTTSPNMAKIYESIEKDEPIQWVRVHNLPDLAYFNHSQHVKVAGLDCENCHGDVKNMEVIQQHSLLTMGWCIDCHRQTEIQKDNKYYDRLVKIHEAKNTKEPLKVEDIGGLECSKCHY